MVTAWYILMNYYYDAGYEYKNLIHRFIIEWIFGLYSREHEKKPFKKDYYQDVITVHTNFSSGKTNSKKHF